MTLSPAQLVDLCLTCDDIVRNINATMDSRSGDALVDFGRMTAETAAAAMTLAEMVKALAEEVSRRG